MDPNKDDKHRHKEQLYRLFAQIANAMANPHRLELLDLLAQAPRTVEELACCGSLRPPSPACGIRGLGLGAKGPLECPFLDDDPVDLSPLYGTAWNPSISDGPCVLRSGSHGKNHGGCGQNVQVRSRD